MPTGTNTWTLGTMYYGGLVDGQPFFTQALGPFTEVLPTQVNAQPWLDYPIPGLVLNEYSPWWAPGCGHSIKFFKIIREYDYTTQSSVALITCNVCSYIQTVYTPFEAWLDPIEHAIIIS
jgi:hypothetical protein